MPTEFNETDSATTDSQGTLMLGATDVPGVIKVVRLDSSGGLITNPGVLVPQEYDELSIAYTTSQITSVVYLLSSTTLTTLTLAYDGDNLTSVVKT